MLEMAEKVKIVSSFTSTNRLFSMLNRRLCFSQTTECLSGSCSNNNKNKHMTYIALNQTHKGAWSHGS